MQPSLADAAPTPGRSRRGYNSNVPPSTDDIMQRASQALVKMDYLSCEALCLEALALARTRADWPTYARILLPLQEARRQRRMIAAEGVIRLGTGDLTAGAPPTTWLDQVQAGCIVLTHPHTSDQAAALLRQARQKRLHIEVLFADNASNQPTWRVQSFDGPPVVCDRPAPPQEWRDRWLPAGEVPVVTDPLAGGPTSTSPTDWFLNAAEALGDAALQQTASSDIDALEPLLAVAPDHEILHQRLAAAARVRRSTKVDR